MSLMKYAAVAAAVVGSAVAQCSTDTMTIRNAQDATSLGSCQTFSGAVAIATDAVGSLNFGSLGAIKGDFIGNSMNVTSIQADSVQSIGRFNLKNMQQLYTLSMQQLRTVDSISWTSVDRLGKPDFGTGLQTVNDAINVENTGIQDLSGMNVRKIMGDVAISNNRQLTGLSWSTTNMSGNFRCAGNGFQQLNLSLVNLESVGKDFDVSNASDVAVPSLSMVGGLFSIQASRLQNLNAPNLTSASQVSVGNNPNLQGVSLDKLNGTTALRLVNNDKLGGDLKFPAVNMIKGDLNITGAFESISMPKLTSIGSTCYLWSTQDIDSTCSHFNDLKSSNAIQGNLPPGPDVKNGIVCHSKSKAASAGGGSGTTSNGQSGAASSSTNAAPGNFIATPATLFGATGLFAAMLGLI